MGSPATLEDFFRVHDLAVYRWWTGLRVKYGTAGGLFASIKDDVSIIAVFSTPDRAYASVAEALRKASWISQSDYDRLLETPDLTVFPLPLSSIHRGDHSLDTELRGTPKTIRGTDTDVLTGKPQVFQFPVPYWVDYTINVFCHKTYSLAFIDEWVASQFGPLGCLPNERLIEVEHAATIGVMYQPLRFEGRADNSDLEGPTPRYRRVDYTFRLRAWMFKAPVQEFGGEVP